MRAAPRGSEDTRPWAGAEAARSLVREGQKRLAAAGEDH